MPGFHSSRNRCYDRARKPSLSLGSGWIGADKREREREDEKRVVPLIKNQKSSL